MISGKIVTIVTRDISPGVGGPVRSIRYAAHGLVKRGLSVNLIYARGISSDFQVGGNEIKVSLGKHSWLSIDYLLFLRGVFYRRDLVWINGTFSFFCLFFILASKIFGCPIVMSPRGAFTKKGFAASNYLAKTMWVYSVDKLMLRKATLLFSSHAELREYFKVTNLSPVNSFVIPNPVFPESHVARIREYNSCPRVLFLGRFAAKKRLFETIDLVCGTLGWFLHIRGFDDDVSTIDLINYLERRDLQTLCSVGPIVNDDQKFSLLASFDICVLLSDSENFGNVVAEALTVKTPVLISPYVGLYEYVAEYNSVCVVKAEDPSADSAIADWWEVNRCQFSFPNSALFGSDQFATEFEKIEAWSD